MNKPIFQYIQKQRNCVVPNREVPLSALETSCLFPLSLQITVCLRREFVTKPTPDWCEYTEIDRDHPFLNEDIRQTIQDVLRIVSDTLRCDFSVFQPPFRIFGHIIAVSQITSFLFLSLLILLIALCFS